MGGLRKETPITFITLMCAALAISGFPFTSGYFSKDAILVAAHAPASDLFWIGVITAGMTAFYVFRSIFLAFFGKYRGHHHAHESPLVMTAPLMVLALLSLAAAFSRSRTSSSPCSRTWSTPSTASSATSRRRRTARHPARVPHVRGQPAHLGVDGDHFQRSVPLAVQQVLRR
jgi:NADH:ubiquinone oxidoreductase subunit 5 (subunit L)/multisubunit Na+/H+ antiporter MnhA subunit